MIRAAIIALVGGLLSGCATIEKAAGWPTPQLVYTNVATENQLFERSLLWQSGGPGRVVCPISATGSMRPYIQGGPGEFMFAEAYEGQPLQVGQVVVFARDPETPRCQHMIADVRGDYVYLTGTNNRRSDGWFPRSAIRFIARELVRLPALPRVAIRGAISQ